MVYNSTVQQFIFKQCLWISSIVYIWNIYISNLISLQWVGRYVWISLQWDSSVVYIWSEHFSCLYLNITVYSVTVQQFTVNTLANVAFYQILIFIMDHIDNIEQVGTLESTNFYRGGG